MSSNFKWPEDATVKDYTLQVKKIWDSELPKKFPEILSFNTKAVVDVFYVENFGFAEFPKNLVKFKCIVNLNPQPIIDMGLYGKETLTINEFERAYGEKFDYQLRNEMIRLLKYLGIFVSQFDFDGDMTYHM